MADNTKRTKKTPEKKDATEPVEPMKADTDNTEEEKVVEKKQQRRWSVDSLFWGLLLVVVGGMILLSNLGVLEVSWMELWRLWPLLVIAAGFSVLATRHWFWRLLSVLFVVFALMAVIAVGTGRYAPEAQWGHQEQSVSLATGVTQAEVEISAGASKLEVVSADTDNVIDASVDGSNSELTKSTRTVDGTQYARVTSDHGWWMMAPGKNDWTVKLTERVPMKLQIEAGASSTNADLSMLHLTSLRLEAGASHTELKLGNKVRELKVDINSGVSSLKIMVPKDSGVSLKFEGGLSSKDVADLKEYSEGEYRSDDYSTAADKIDLVVDAGLSSLDIVRY